MDYGLLLIDLVIDLSILSVAIVPPKTGLKLCKKLKDGDVNGFCTDYWKRYYEFIPNHKHMQSKAETFTIEGYNSKIRYYLACFRRRIYDGKISKITYVKTK